MSQYFGGVAICQWCDKCLDILVQKSHPNHTQPLPPSLQHRTYGRNHWHLATPFVWPFTADLPYEGCSSESRGPDNFVHIKLFFTFYSENMPVPGQRNYQPSISVYVKLSYKYLYRQDNIEVHCTSENSSHRQCQYLFLHTQSECFCRKQLYGVNCMSSSRVIHRIPALPTNHHVFPRSLSNSQQQCPTFCLPSSPILFSHTLKVAFDFLSFEIMTAPKWMFVLVTFLVTVLKYVTEAA